MRSVVADNSQVQVIARAAAILRSLENQPAGLSLAEIADQVGLAKSTTHRILAALELEGLVMMGAAKAGIRLGPMISRLAASARMDFVELIHPTLVAVSEALGETVDLSIAQRGHLVFVDQVRGPHRLQAVSSVGDTFPLHCTANGKAYLASLTDDGVRRILPATLEARTENTITDLDQLLADIAQVRRAGVALDREEHTVGICAVGVFLQDPVGDNLAVSVPVPTPRFHGREGQITERLLAARGEMLDRMTRAARTGG